MLSRGGNKKGKTNMDVWALVSYQVVVINHVSHDPFVSGFVTRVCEQVRGCLLTFFSRLH